MSLRQNRFAWVQHKKMFRDVKMCPSLAQMLNRMKQGTPKSPQKSDMSDTGCDETDTSKRHRKIPTKKLSK